MSLKFCSFAKRKTKENQLKNKPKQFKLIYAPTHRELLIPMRNANSVNYSKGEEKQNNNRKLINYGQSVLQSKHSFAIIGERDRRRFLSYKLKMLLGHFLISIRIIIMLVKHPEKHSLVEQTSNFIPINGRLTICCFLIPAD